MRTFLAGGTGTPGRAPAARASESGHAVRALSRHAADRQPDGVERALGDLVTGAGLDEVVPEPRLQSQAVRLRDVVGHLRGLLAEGAAGRAPDFGGPRPGELPDMLRRCVTTIAARVRVLAVPLVGPTQGSNEAEVLQPGGVRARVTFDDRLRATAP